MVEWNELERKTKITTALIAVAVLLAVALLIAAFTIAKRYGGADVAKIVRDSVENQKITQGGNGYRIVADHAMVTFRQNVPAKRRETIVSDAGGKLSAPLADRADSYAISFRPATWREIKTLLDRLRANPDVISAEPLTVDQTPPM